MHFRDRKPVASEPSKPAELGFEGIEGFFAARVSKLGAALISNRDAQ